MKIEKSHMSKSKPCFYILGKKAFRCHLETWENQVGSTFKLNIKKKCQIPKKNFFPAPSSHHLPPPPPNFQFIPCPLPPPPPKYQKNTLPSSITTPWQYLCILKSQRGQGRNWYLGCAGERWWEEGAGKNIFWGIWHFFYIQIKITSN